MANADPPATVPVKRKAKKKPPPKVSKPAVVPKPAAKRKARRKKVPPAALVAAPSSLGFDPAAVKQAAKAGTPKHMVAIMCGVEYETLQGEALVVFDDFYRRGVADGVHAAMTGIHKAAKVGDISAAAVYFSAVGFDPDNPNTAASEAPNGTPTVAPPLRIVVTQE